MHVGIGWFLLVGEIVTPTSAPSSAAVRIDLVRIDPASDAAAPGAAEESRVERMRDAPPDPRVAVATTAPERAELTPRERVSDTPREPTPDSPAEPERQDELEPVEYVRTDHADRPAPDAERISSHDRVARSEPTRARVSAQKEGPRRRHEHGERFDSAPIDELRSRAARGRVAGTASDRARSGLQVTRIEGGGGSRSDGLARATSGQRGTQSEGGSPARAAAGSDRPDQRLSPSGTGGSDGYRAADAGRFQHRFAGDGLALAPVSSPEHGNPRPRRTARAASDLASETTGDGLAMADTPGIAADQGGRPDIDIDAPASPGHRQAADSGTASGDASAPFDPVQDLQSFFGWERPEFADDDVAGASGSGQSDGMESTSPQANDGDRVREYVDVSARKDPLGVYMRRVEDVLNARWRDNDLSVADRARGIQGEVVVRYVIEANGRIENVDIVRHSGHVELDLLALSAVPDRVARIPRTLERDRIHQQVTFRYRNPLVIHVAGSDR